MNLTFLHPFFLLGLAAGVLPVLIHRLTQRKALFRRFSAVRLLLQSQRVTARPQRLKHLLLLALRILAVISLVSMMAKPILIRPGVAALRSGGAQVVILDNSLSMGFRDERGLRFDLAKKAVKEALEGVEGQVAIIPMVPPPATQPTGNGPLWARAEEAVKALETIPLTFARGEAASALGRVYQTLKDLKTPKQILVVSDMARGDWETLDLSTLGTISDAEVTFLRIGGPSRDPNLCIKNVSLTEGGEAVVGVPARLESTLSNLSDKPDAALVQLSLSGIKVDQKSISLRPGEDGKVSFELYLDKPGWIDGEVSLSADRLPSDDLFYFPLKVREKVKVLVVDGDPRTSLKASESFYLVNALLPGGSEGSPFSVTVITEGEMAGVNLKSYDAVFFLNVAKPDPSRLASFLELGRPAFIFLGDRISPEAYNDFSLVPWRIGEAMDTDHNPERIARVDQSRETLKSLANGGDSLKNALFRRYFKVEGMSRNLLTLGNQDPLLVEADVGRSRIFLFASSADLDWNDLALKAAYLPLIQGLLKEAVGLAGNALAPDLRVGDPFKEQGRPVQIKGPHDGPGIYQFSLPSGEVRQGLNTPYEESNLTKLTEDDLKKRFGTLEVSVMEYKEGSVKDLQTAKKDLWPFFLGFLMIVLATEMMLANGVLWSKP